MNVIYRTRYEHIISKTFTDEDGKKKKKWNKNTCTFSSHVVRQRKFKNQIDKEKARKNKKKWNIKKCIRV